MVSYPATRAARCHGGSSPYSAHRRGYCVRPGVAIRVCDVGASAHRRRVELPGNGRFSFVLIFAGSQLLKGSLNGTLAFEPDLDGSGLGQFQAGPLHFGSVDPPVEALRERDHDADALAAGQFGILDVEVQRPLLHGLPFGREDGPGGPQLQQGLQQGTLLLLVQAEVPDPQALPEDLHLAPVGVGSGNELKARLSRGNFADVLLEVVASHGLDAGLRERQPDRRSGFR